MVHLSVILPTSGRASIARMLDSLRGQSWELGDELLIVGTVNEPVSQRVSQIVDRAIHPRLDVTHFAHTLGNNWGHAERNFAMPLALGTHLMFIDDDDVLLPGAVTAIRLACNRRPDLPHMFRMVDPGGTILWKYPEVDQGNHGTPQFVVPNNPQRLGQWGDRYEGDFDFVTSTMKLYPDGVYNIVWDSTIIYSCRDAVL